MGKSLVASKTPRRKPVLRAAVQIGLVNLINTEFEKMQASFSDLPDDVLCQPGAIGDWSVKDVLVHLTAWEKRLLQRVAGKIEDGTGLGTPQFNGKVYLENRDRTIEDVRTEFYRIHKKVVKLAASLSASDIEKWQQSFQFNTSNHYKWAGINLRRWRRTAR